MTGEAFATGGPDGGAEGFVIGERGDDVHDDGLAGEGAGFTPHAAVGYARDAEDDGLDFGGHELLPADVDRLAQAAEDPQRAVGAGLGFVARAEPTVGGEAFVTGVQVAGDLRAAAQPELVVDELPLEVRVLEAEESRILRRAGRAGDAGLARAESLDETGPRKSGLEPDQQAFRHRLRPVGDEAQGGEIVFLGDARTQQQAEEGRRGRQDRDAMAGDRRGDVSRRGRGGQHERRAGGEAAEERVESADVVEAEQAEDGQAVRPALRIGREQGREVMDHRLGRPAGAAREQDQAGGAATTQGFEQRVGRGFVDPRQEAPSDAVGGDDPLRVDLREAGRVLGGITGERHDEMPRGFEREQPSGRGGAMTADDGDGRRTGQAQAREGLVRFGDQSGQLTVSHHAPGTDQGGPGGIGGEAGEERHAQQEG